MLFVILVNMTWGTMKKGLPPSNEAGHSKQEIIIALLLRYISREFEPRQGLKVWEALSNIACLPTSMSFKMCLQDS